MAASPGQLAPLRGTGTPRRWARWRTRLTARSSSPPAPSAPSSSGARAALPPSVGSSPASAPPSWAWPSRPTGGATPSRARTTPCASCPPSRSRWSRSAAGCSPLPPPGTRSPTRRCARSWCCPCATRRGRCSSGHSTPRGTRASWWWCPATQVPVRPRCSRPSTPTPRPGGAGRRAPTHRGAARFASSSLWPSPQTATHSSPWSPGPRRNWRRWNRLSFGRPPISSWAQRSPPSQPHSTEAAKRAPKRRARRWLASRWAQRGSLGGSFTRASTRRTSAA
mmetsp:Transcript_32647/g.81191  ORF Transcript_32647/g.81191 Transcript_32647/m.81191 type:complete len:280 (+) Transcript_32647:318-1157(+)